MQGFLITLATAMIAVILAAFAAPFVVDWNAWRPAFESEASHILGVPVLIRGPIEAELLPAPRLVLRGVSVGADAVSTGGALEEVSAHFSLGALFRGQLEARELTLVRPHLRVVLDSTGRIALPAGAGTGTGLNIARLTVSGGTLDLLDRGADRAVTLSGLDLRGEATSFQGPFRLEGEGDAGGRRYGLRFSLGRMASEGGKLRLIAEERGGPLALDLDGSFRLDGGAPRFDGRGSLAWRVAGGDASAAGTLPWRLSGALRMSPEAAVAETLDLTLGDEARPVQLSGSARLDLGRARGLDAVFNARAFDADLLAPIGATPRSPAEALSTLALRFAGLPPAPFPVRIGAATDQFTIGGTVVREARLDLAGGPEGWRITTAEATLPGPASVRLSGSRAAQDQNAGFSGDLTFSAEDPATFLRWAAPRVPAAYVAAVSGPASLTGRVSVQDNRVAVANLTLAMGAARATGSGAFLLGAPARLDLSLALDGFDLDPLLDAVRLGLEGAGSAVEGAVALEGRNLTLAGLPLDVLSVAATGRGTGWTVSRLVLDGLSGLRLEGGGEVQRLAMPVIGRLDLQVAGPRAEGLVPVARLVAGTEAADVLARLGPMAAPVRLSVGANWGEGGARSLRAEGTLGQISGRALFERTAPNRPDRVEIAVSAADAARALEAAGLKGLEEGQGAGRLDLMLRPADDGSALFTGTLALPEASATGRGEVRIGPAGALVPRIAVTLESADLSQVFAPVAGLDAGPLPATLTFTLGRQDGQWRFDELRGTLLGAPVEGAIGLDPALPRLTGRLAVEALSLPRILGLWGARSSGSEVGPGPWSAARFAPFTPPGLSALLDLSAHRLALGDGYGLTDARLRVRAEGATLEIRDLSGAFGEGRLSGGLTLRRRQDTVSAEGHVALDAVNAAALLAPVSGRLEPRGRVSLVADLIGTGRTPAQLVQSLSGQGTLSVRDLEVAAADPSAIDAVLADTAAGTPPDERRTAQMFDRALQRGPLTVETIEGAFGVVNGVARLSTARAQLGNPSGGTRVSAGGTLDLARLTLDATLDLEQAGAGAAAAGGSIGWRGPLAAPERRVTASALTAVIAMRAIERETRRLEEQRLAPADSTPRAPATSPPAAPIALPPAAPAPAPGASGAASGPRGPVNPVTGEGVSTSPPPSPPASGSASPGIRAPAANPRPAVSQPPAASRGPAASENRAPALPPPLEIAPAVRPRAAAPSPAVPAYPSQSIPSRPLPPPSDPLPSGFGPLLLRPPATITGE